jgi:HK97 family phage portal protein
LRKAYPPDDDFWYRAIVPNVKSGVAVDAVSALSLSAVYACIRILSDTMGVLPVRLYEKDSDDNRTRRSDMKIAQLFEKLPNPEMSAFRWKQISQGHLCGWGNSFSYVERDGANRVVALWPLRPDRMTVRRGADNSTLTYEYNGNRGKVTLSEDQVFHIAGFGYDGMTGYSPIRLAQESIGIGLAAEEFGARFYGNGTHMGAVVKHPKRLTPDAQKKLQTSMTAGYAGLGNSHKLLVLDEGMDIAKIGIPPEEAQFLQTRKFQVNEICRWYRVPPHMVADLERSTFNNIEHMGLEFAIYTMLPWVTLHAQEMTRYFLSPAQQLNMYFEYDLNALLKGDFKTRSEGYATALSNGWLNRDEVRKMENLNPMPGEGGKIYTVQLAMTNIEHVVNPPEPMAPAGPANSDDDDDDNNDDGGGDNDDAGKARRIALVKRSSPAERDRIIKAYVPLFRRAGLEVVRKESLAVRKAAEQNSLKRQGDSDFTRWLEDFYKGLPEYIRAHLGPVFDSFATQIEAAAAIEIGVDPESTPGFRAWVGKYIDQYIERHVGESKRQILATMEKQGVAGIGSRMAEWEEDRPQKITDKETVRMSSGVSRLVWFSAGLGAIWATRSDACEFCRQLAGTKITKGQSFVVPGDAIPSTVGADMAIRRPKGHPPLHGGCHCYIIPG